MKKRCYGPSHETPVDLDTIHFAYHPSTKDRLRPQCRACQCMAEALRRKKKRWRAGSFGSTPPGKLGRMSEP